ncbi:MAG: tetratricopeptide repeat protein [Chlamydiae bacterium]|nr:tetratricopeptide repeat protein [Chlamydiota bacterium]MBI3276497.1 tetratricopeptide repeat protein [Chlamydiota bacterium]
MIKWVLLFFILIHVSGCSHPSDSSQNDDQKIDKAQKELEKDYNNPRLHTRLGVLYEKKGLTSQAEKHYRIAVKLDPQGTEPLLNLGNLYLEEKDYPNGLSTLQKALQIAPQDPKINYLVATLDREAKQYPDALLYYQKVLDRDPHHVFAQNYIGVTHYELKEYPQAEAAFQKAVQIDSQFADAYGNLAFLYDFNLHDKKKAIEYYEKFLQLRPQGENVTLAQELLSKAKKEVENEVKNTPVSPSPIIHEEIQAPPETIVSPPPKEISEDVLATPPPIVLVKPVDHHETSQPTTERPLPRDPAQAMRYFKQAVSDQSKGENAQAILEYQKSLALNPSYVNAHYNLGILYKWNGENDKAIHEYEEAIKLNPKLEKAYYNMGVLLKEKGSIDEAILAFKKTIQLDARYSDAYLGLGLIYNQNKKDSPQAIGYYKKYLELHPSGSTADKIRAWLNSVDKH